MSTKNHKEVVSATVSQPKRLCSRNNRNNDAGETEPQNRHDVENCAIVEFNVFSLLHIFNRLGIRDLCNVADVNHQFKRVSKMSFAGRYATFIYSHSTASSKAQMRRVLCKFGDLIKSMRVEGSYDSYRYPIELDAISKFCAGTMNELIVNLCLNLNCDDRAKPLFSSLKMLTLNISGFFPGDTRGVFTECHELRTLRLLKVRYTEFIFELTHNYPKLDELYIERANRANAEAIFGLLEKNQHIKKLNINDACANETIYAIASKMSRLEKLSLESGNYSTNCDNVTKLAGLKSLKTLELHGAATYFVDAIEALENIPLKSFKWFNCPSDLQFTREIGKLKTLKSLTLTGISLSFDDCFAALTDQLTLLHELELGFKRQRKQVLSTGGLIKFVERSTSLNALIIHTRHSKLFDQEFYDSLLEVILRRSSSSSPETFNVTIYCLRSTATALQVHCNLLHVKFVPRSL